MSDPAPRNELLRLVMGVVAIDVAAIGAYTLGGVGAGPPRTRIAFTAVWTIATLVVVLIGLRRLREARVSARRAGGRR